jgi:hypothetical protein
MKTLLILLTAALACAEPVKLKNVEANELLGALAQIGPGLTAQNTTRVARDMNALRPVVEAWARGEQAARERLKITAATKIDSAEGAAFLAEAKRNNEDSFTLDLQSLSLSDEEITAAKMPPFVLAAVLRYLSAPEPRKAH